MSTGTGTGTGAENVNHRARASEAYRLWWVTLTENRAETCLRGDKACRLLMRVRTPLAHDDTKD
jgi:hypothetical protein